MRLFGAVLQSVLFDLSTFLSRMCVVVWMICRLHVAVVSRIQLLCGQRRAAGSEITSFISLLSKDDGFNFYGLRANCQSAKLK